MNRVRLLAVTSLLPLLALPLTAVPALGDQPRADDAQVGVSRHASLVKLRATTQSGRTYVPAPAPRAGPAAAPAANIQVTYSGFTRPAKRAFQRAVNTWKPLLNSSVPIRVNASFQPLGAGVLGSAGPGNFWRDFDGAPTAGTWYADAIANKRAGEDLAPGQPEIIARFNSNFSNWYYGGDGNPPNNRYDFQSVVLHELGHGLGFLGFGTVNGSAGTVRLQGFPSAYDRFTENQGGTRLLTFPDNSTQLGNQLTSNQIYFDSPKVRNAAGGNRARLYAPASWQQGSSYSHLNEGTYGPGNVNSLMTPAIADAEAIHNPGPIVRAIFASTGW